MTNRLVKIKICADCPSVSGQPSRCSLQYDIISPLAHKPGAQNLKFDADGHKMCHCYIKIRQGYKNFKCF